MSKKNLAKSLIVTLLAMLLPALTLAWTSPPSLAESDGISLTLKLELPSYEIARDEHGFDTLWLEGFNLSAPPGTPLLPRKVYHVALPPRLPSAT